MRKGWEVELTNGEVLKENKYKWKDVPKNKIKRLTLHFEGRRWDISGKEAYFVKTSASMVPGINESFRVEKRCIGYYEGAAKVSYVVDESTGRLEILVK